MSTTEGEGYAIELKHITKRFGEVVANDNINLAVRHGEILALLGENGSGKTTLMNILSGIYHPDQGQIYINGEQKVIASPVDAIKMGIGMIHQHLKLVDVFTGMDNIMLGTKGRYETPAVRREKIQKISEQYGLDIIPDKYVSDMSVSEKQTVEVLKVLYRGVHSLILDEPTAVLTPQESKKLFTILRKMRDQGCAIIIITHKLNEVMEISDRVTILRKGKSIETVITANTNEQQLTELMVGKPVNLSIDRPEYEKKETLLTIQNLTVKKREGTKGIEHLSFDLYAGEILGVAGIAGSGQKELCETIAGLRKAEEGSVFCHGEELLSKSVKEREEAVVKVGFVPEDRLGMGLVSAMGMTENILLREYRKQKGIFLRKREARKEAKKLMELLQVAAPSIEFPVRMMSGGNVQKVLLGREISRRPDVLVTAYPLWGLDIHSSYLVYELLNEQKMRGAGVLFIGEDLDVLLSLSDRILVLCNGEMTGIVDARNATKEEVGRLMTGEKVVITDGANPSEEERAVHSY